MATRLIQVLTFTNVAGGATVPLAHSINVNGVPKIPDIVLQDNADFTVDSVSSTTATVTNTSGAPATLNLWLEYKHSMDRAFGDGSTQQLTPAPFVPATGGGGGGAYPDIVNNAGVDVQIAVPTSIDADLGGGAPGNYVGLAAVAGIGGTEASAYHSTDGVTSVAGFRAGYFRFEDVFAASDYYGIFVGAGATINDQNVFKSFIVAEAGGAGGSFSGFERAGEMAIVGGYAIVFVFNHGPGTITLLNQDAGSSANNRIICPGGVNKVIPAGGGWVMAYDAILANRWRIIAVAE